MKCFALAVFVSATSALEHGSGFTYSAHQPSYHKPTSYHQPKSGYHAPQHTQTKGYQSAPSGYGGVAAPSYSYGTNSYYHQPNHAHNPFEYSRPQIPYVAAKLSAPVYATCVENESPRLDHRYIFKFGQLPGHPIQVQGTFTYDSDSGNTDGDVISFTIHKYGDIKHDYETSTLCNDIGPVFNPLQDPHITETETRGTIDDVIVAAASQDVVDGNDTRTWSQSALLQNLGGPNSLIGRSIYIMYDEAGVDGCCVIGLDAPPAPTTKAYTPHYHPAQHYGYGGYGHQGHHYGGGHHGNHGHH